MLTESFVAAVAGSEKPTAPSAVFKDAGIFLYNFQPTPLLKATFKKSSANTNCLAISPTHVFTAQTDKSVIHVYSRERGNQEAIVPFPERISCLTLITSGNAGVDVLACGTEKGRLILWEAGLTLFDAIACLILHVAIDRTAGVDPSIALTADILHYC